MTRQDSVACATGAPVVSARDRILNAAFAVLCERGYAATSTREIAARARVSKRELYSEFGSKDGIFGALIAARAARMRQPLALAAVADRAGLTATLRGFGRAFLGELCDPGVVSMFRLAASAAEQSHDMARVLEVNAYVPNRQALIELMTQARAAGLVTGDPLRMTRQFAALLTGEVHLPLLLGLVDTPSPAEIAAYADAATEAFLQLHGRPEPRIARAGAGRARPKRRA